jgi:diaminohydroxyphosphoribosylaminopyrimidine deaminase/5-amino-6-(5-phosphoribosylamino)uracil reductase
LIAAGIGRVVMALEDPFPQVAGQGAARLRAAGISVDEGLGAEAAREINIGFFSRVLRKRPWVRLKSAISLDGRTALPSGQSQWITGPAARADGHAWRKRASAVLTGIGTVMHDDPMLDVRFVPAAKQPQRVVLDSSLRCPANARILQGSRGAWLFTTIDEAGVAASTHAQALSERGAVIFSQPGKDGRLDLVNVLHDLAERGINELHVEAGPQLSGAFIAQGLVDETLIYVAPKLLGHGLPLAQLPPLAQLSDAAELRFVDACAVGEDWRFRLRPRNGFGSA